MLEFGETLDGDRLIDGAAQRASDECGSRRR
jgi:hypothetical protein